MIKRYFNNGFLLLVILFAGCSAGSVDIPVSVEDNLSVFDSIINKLFQELNPLLDRNNSIYYIVDESAPVSQKYFDGRFQKNILKNGGQVFLTGNAGNIINSGKTGRLVSLKVVRMTVDYGYVKENSKRKKLSREVTVQVFYNITDCESGKVLAADTFDDNYRDYISPEDIEDIQRVGLPFTVNVLEQRERGLRELLELGLILTTAGTIIYLLFATRS